MKYTSFLVILFVFILCMLCPAEAMQAAKTDAAPAMKIAIINSRDILTRCERGVKVIKDIQNKFLGKRTQLGLLEQDIRTLQESAKTSPAKNQRATTLQEKMQKYAAEEHNLLQEVTQEESVQFKPILDVVNKTLEEYAKENNISAIQERGVFVYYNRSLDITEEIIKRINLAK